MKLSELPPSMKLTLHLECDDCDFVDQVNPYSTVKLPEMIERARNKKHRHADATGHDVTVYADSDPHAEPAD